MPPQWIFLCAIIVPLHGFVHELQCGQTTVGTSKHGEVTTFHLNTNEIQNVMLFDVNGTFDPVVMVKSASGQYQETVFPIGCGVDGEEDCDEVMFMVKVQIQDEYLMDFIPGEHGGDFRVDVVCSNEQLEGNDTVGSRDFHARRLVAAYSEFDQWIDDMDDHEINYFYNLLMNGQMDRVMDAFYDDADYYHDDGYYGDYYEDEMPSLGGLVKNVKNAFQSKPYTGPTDIPDAYRYGFVKNSAICMPVGSSCNPWQYTTFKDYMLPQNKNAPRRRPDEKLQTDIAPSQMAKQMQFAQDMDSYKRNGAKNQFTHKVPLARDYCCSGYCRISDRMAVPNKGVNYWGKCDLTKEQKRTKTRKRKKLESATTNAHHGVVPHPQGV